MYGINDPKLQLLFNDNIIDIAVPSRNRTLQSIYDIVILKENGVASFYTPSKKQASLELGDKLLGNIIRITATGDYVYFLENTGRIVRFSYPIGSDIGGFQTVSTAISNFDKNKVIDFSSIGDRHYLSYIGAHDSRDAKGNLVLKHLRNYSQIKWVINSRQ